MTKAQICKV